MNLFFKSFLNFNVNCGIIVCFWAGVLAYIFMVNTPVWAADSIGVWPHSTATSPVFELSGLQVNSLTIPAESVRYSDYLIDLDTNNVKSANGHWLRSQHTLRYCLDRDLPISGAANPIFMRFTLSGAEWQDQDFRLYVEEAAVHQPLAGRGLQFHLGNQFAGDEVVEVPVHVEEGGAGFNSVLLRFASGVDLPDKVCLLLGRSPFQQYGGQIYGTRGNFKLKILQGSEGVRIQADTYFLAEQTFQHLQTANAYIEIKPQFSLEVLQRDRAVLNVGNIAPYNRQFQSMYAPVTAFNQFEAKYRLLQQTGIEDAIQLQTEDVVHLQLHNGLNVQQSEHLIQEVWSENTGGFTLDDGAWQLRSSGRYWDKQAVQTLRVQYAQQFSLPTHGWYLQASLQLAAWDQALLLSPVNDHNMPLLYLELASAEAALRVYPRSNTYLRWRADTEPSHLQVSTVGANTLLLSQPEQGFFSGVDADAFSLLNTANFWRLQQGDEPVSLQIQCQHPTAGQSYQAVFSLLSNDPQQPILNYSLSCYLPSPIYQSRPAPDSVLFLQQQAFGELATTHLDITAMGEQGLEIIDWVLSGENADKFHIETEKSAYIEANTSYRLILACLPDELTQHQQQARLTIFSNDPEREQSHYQLYCDASNTSRADHQFQFMFEDVLGQSVTQIDASQRVSIKAWLRPDSEHRGLSAQIGIIYRYRSPSGKTQSFPIVLAENQVLAAEISWLLFQGRLLHLPGYFDLSLYYLLSDQTLRESHISTLKVRQNRSPYAMQLVGNQISEQAEAGTAIGYLETMDADKEEVFRYSLVGNPSGYFSITDKQLQLGHTFPPNFEQEQDLLITVRSWDRSGAFVDKDFVVQVRNQIEARFDAMLESRGQRWYQQDDILLSPVDEFDLSLRLQPDGTHLGSFADILLHLSYYNTDGNLQQTTLRLRENIALEADMNLGIYQGNAQGLEGHFELQAGYQLLASTRHNLVTVMQPVLDFEVKYAE